MSGLRKKLDSLGTETGLMEMMLAGVKCALTRQPFSLPEDLGNLAAAQQAKSWTHLFKGWISSRQWMDRQHDCIRAKVTKKNNALNWATAVIDYLFTQSFEVWDQRNLDCHRHDCQGRANKLKDVAFREITHLHTFEEAVPGDISLLFQTPLEDCLHWPLFRPQAWISNWENVIEKDSAAQVEMGQLVIIPIVILIKPFEHSLHHHQPTFSQDTESLPHSIVSEQHDASFVSSSLCDDVSPSVCC